MLSAANRSALCTALVNDFDAIERMMCTVRAEQAEVYMSVHMSIHMSICTEGQGEAR